MLNKTKELFCMILSFFSDYFKKANRKQLMLQQNAQQQAICNYAQQLQQQIQLELFLALGNNHYTNLHPITVSNHIRIHRWYIRHGTFIFQYRLSTQSIPAQTLLNLMCQNMNTDIYQCLQNLIDTYPLNVVEMLYPCLFWGLYVIDIRPIGNDICISVVTNFK